MSRLIDRLNGVEVAGEIIRRSDGRAYVPPSAPHSLPPSQTEGFWILLDVLQRRKWTILGFFLLVVLLVTAGSFLKKPRYEAVSRIVFNRENANPLGFKDLGDALPADSDYSVSLDTQVQILQSDTLAAQVIRTLHLDQNVRGFVAGLSVSKEKNTRVIDIRYKSTDPKLSADIANAVTQAYIEHNFKMRFQSTNQTSNWLTEQLTGLATKVQESQQKLVDYQKEHGFVELDDKQNVVMTRLDDLNRELTAAQADRIRKEAGYRLSLSENAELTAKAEPDALLEKLHAQEADLKTQYAQATVQLGPSNAKVQELSNQLQETQSQIKAELHKMSDRVRTQYFEAQAREKLLRGAVQEHKQQANQLSEGAIEYSLLKRDAESNRQLYEGLLQKLKEAGVSAGMRSSNIEVVDVAEVPARPTEPNIPRNLFMASLLGMVGGIGLAFIQEKFDRTVRGFHQVQQLSSFPQLGIIPLASGNGSRLRLSPPLSLGSSASAQGSVHLVVNSDPMSPIAESYRALVNSILLSAPMPPKIILLTSAITGDGKTSTSINVATVLAKQGKQVLLVDADFRRPSIHKAMQLPATDGLSTILRDADHRSVKRDGHRSESAPFPAPGIPNLFVMPAGPLDAEPSELAGSKAMQDLLQVWSTQFDYIIVDSSPVVLVSDSVRLAVSADSVILVVRWGHTPREAFARAQELLTQVNAVVMGIVFNGADLSSPGYGYYNQYGYYDSSQQTNQVHKN